VCFLFYYILAAHWYTTLDISYLQDRLPIALSFGLGAMICVQSPLLCRPWQGLLRSDGSLERHLGAHKSSLAWGKGRALLVDRFSAKERELDFAALASAKVGTMAMAILKFRSG
jgi:hypothetical protein